MYTAALHKSANSRSGKNKPPRKGSENKAYIIVVWNNIAQFVWNKNILFYFLCWNCLDLFGVKSSGVKAAWCDIFLVKRFLVQMPCDPKGFWY